LKLVFWEPRAGGKKKASWRSVDRHEKENWKRGTSDEYNFFVPAGVRTGLANKKSRPLGGGKDRGGKVSLLGQILCEKRNARKGRGADLDQPRDLGNTKKKNAETVVPGDSQREG